jgi:hypothetical protein
VLIALNDVVQLQLHYAPYPDLNQLFFLVALFLNIVLFLLLLYVLILVLLETPSILNIQFCKITFVVFLCAIAKPYESLSGFHRRESKSRRCRMEANFKRMSNFLAFRRLSLRISFRTDTLSCFLSDQAAAIYSRLSGTVNSRFGRQQRGQQTRQPLSMRT